MLNLTTIVALFLAFFSKLLAKLLTHLNLQSPPSRLTQLELRISGNNSKSVFFRSAQRSPCVCVSALEGGAYEFKALEMTFPIKNPSTLRTIAIRTTSERGDYDYPSEHNA
jgi:hypothetical protein